MDDLLDKVRQWMILRFALNTEDDLWVWLSILGVAAHLEHRAVEVLWVEEGKPTSYEKYRPKMTLGGATDLIRKRNLLDLTTVGTLKKVADLRNSVAHRSATYGVSFLIGDPTRGKYKGHHVFTEPEGLKQLMDDADAATKSISDWLNQHDLDRRPPDPTPRSA